MLNPLVQGSKRRRDLGDDANAGLEEMDYRADEGLSARGDAYATRASDWDMEGQADKAAGQEKKIRLNEASLGVL